MTKSATAQSQRKTQYDRDSENEMENIQENLTSYKRTKQVRTKLAVVNF